MKRFIAPPLAVLTIALLVMVPGARAHQPGLSFLSLSPETDRLAGRFDVSLRDLELAVGLDQDNNGSVTYEELVSRQPAIGEYVQQRLHLKGDETDLPLKVTEHKVASDQDGIYAVIEFETSWPRLPKLLIVKTRLFHEIDSQHRTLTQLTTTGEPVTAILSLTDSQREFPLSDATLAGSADAASDGEKTAQATSPVSRNRQAAEFFHLGVHHIWTGYDHILFLLALLLPAVLMRGPGGWTGIERFRPAFINVVKVVTAFTVAHSITLSLAVLQIVEINSRLIEIIIAASVAVAAANNLRPVVLERTWLVAFGFGLIHGFGFANALDMMHLPVTSKALALASFNLGVEAGQLAIVAVFLPTAYHLRSKELYHRHILRWGSAAIVILALWWMIERITQE